MGLDIREYDDFLERFYSFGNKSDLGQRIMFATIIQHRIVGKKNLRFDLRKSVEN